jgi:hypothetical protein
MAAWSRVPVLRVLAPIWAAQGTVSERFAEKYRSYQTDAPGTVDWRYWCEFLDASRQDIEAYEASVAAAASTGAPLVMGLCALTVRLVEASGFYLADPSQCRRDWPRDGPQLTICA